MCLTILTRVCQFINTSTQALIVMCLIWLNSTPVLPNVSYWKTVILGNFGMAIENPKVTEISRYLGTQKTDAFRSQDVFDICTLTFNPKLVSFPYFGTQLNILKRFIWFDVERQLYDQAEISANRHIMQLIFIIRATSGTEFLR